VVTFSRAASDLEVFLQVTALDGPMARDAGSGASDERGVTSRARSSGSGELADGSLVDCRDRRGDGQELRGRMRGKRAFVI
jgi:hypothetical protein